MHETYVTIQGNVATALRSGLARQGTPYASFRLASTVRRQTDQGWQDVATSFYQVVCYRALAEHVVASLQIGQPVVVYGRQVVRQWEKDGKQGSDVDVEAYAVGHDLNRGTSIFARRGMRQHAEPAAREVEAPAPAGPLQPVGADGEAAASAA